MVDSYNLLEDKKSNVFFKVSNVIKELNAPSLIRNLNLLSNNEMEKELSKLKELWENDFDSLSKFLEEDMRA